MKKIGYAVFLWIAIFTNINAQQALVDSLRNALEIAPPDTNKVILLCDLAYYLYSTAPTESLAYSEQGLALAQQLKYPEGKANALYKMSMARMTLGEYPEAIARAEEGLELAREAGLLSRVSDCTNVLSLIYIDMNDTQKALQYAFESIQTSEASKDTADMASAYHNVGKIYQVNNDYINAKKYFEKSLAAYQQIGRERLIAVAYSSLSTVEENPKKRRDYLLKAIEIGARIENNNILGYAYGNLGGYYYVEEKDAVKALEYYRKSRDAAVQTGDLYLIANVDYEMGQVFMIVEQIDSAKVHLQASLDWARAQGNDIFIQANLKFLSQCYAEEENYAKAYELMKETVELSDSIHSQNLAQQLAEADARYENSQKEAQIAEQELQIARQQNARNQILIGGIVLLLLATAIFQWYYNLQRRKKREAELALKLERTEAKNLRDLDTLKSNFFTNISHELRTPLTLVLGPLEDALQKTDKSNLREDLQLAQNNGKKLLTLVNEILDLSKLESGKLTLHESTVNLQQILRRIFFAFESLAKLRQINLTFTNELPEELNVKLDVNKFEKIINNLISNALKHTSSGDTVSLHASKASSGQIQIQIKDTGQGIHTEDLPHVFDRFYQSTRLGEPLQGGTGVGLALAREYARLFGGDLKAVSELGKGSAFVLEIPLQKSDNVNVITDEPVSEKTEADKNVYEPILLNGKQPRLLIVEDNLEMSQYLQRILSKNYHGTLAPNGAVALQLLQKEHFDLIISDVMMPRMDGFALREKVNQLPRLQGIPFVMLTARVLEEDRLFGLRLGVDDYITKPFNAKELEARIFNLLRNKQIREQALAETSDFDENVEQKLLKDAEQIVFNNLSNLSFKVNDLASNLGYSERQLRRVLKIVTGLSPVEFILELRLLRARQLLELEKFATISEVRYEVGIESASYFTKKFMERFGKNPTDWMQ